MHLTCHGVNFGGQLPSFLYCIFLKKVVEEMSFNLFNCNMNDKSENLKKFLTSKSPKFIYSCFASRL